MNLDDICFPAMTVRELLKRSFNDDWNNRRIVLNMDKEATFSANLYLSLKDIPHNLCLEALKEA
jgi:hypothetical protein